MKKLILPILVSLVALTACSLSDGSDSSDSVLTVDLSGGAAGTVQPKSDILVESAQITQATVTLTAPDGTSQSAVWVPGNSLSYVFRSMQTGPHLLVVVDYDALGHVNYATNAVNLRRNYNYHVTVRLGGQIYVDAPLDPLVAEYLLDGNAADTSGNGFNGGINGAQLTNDRFGHPNSAYFFPTNGATFGVGASITISNTGMKNLFTNQFSSSFWARPEVLTCRILGNLDNGNPNAGGYRFDLSAGNFIFTIVRSNSNGSIAVTNTSISVIPGTYYHVAGTYDRSSGRISLSVNNITVSALNFSDAMFQYVGQFPYYEYFDLGRYWGSGATYYCGSLDDVRIYRKALSATEITALYNEIH